jgi:hypothetical protein
MIIDNDLNFVAVSGTTWTAQAETTQAAHISDNVIDLGRAAARTILKNMYFVFQIETAITTASAATLQIDLVNSAAAGLGTDTHLWSSGIIATGVVVAWTANSTVYVDPCSIGDTVAVSRCDLHHRDRNIHGR